jgi:hypothetical protein
VIESVESICAESVPQLSLFPPQSSNFLTPRPRAASAPVALDDRRSSTVRGNPGFLGSTSYSAVFEQDLESFGVPTADLHTQDVVPTVPVASEKLLRGCKVLAIFKDNSLVNRFMNKYFEINDNSGEVAIFPIIRLWLREIWSHHRETLRDQVPEKVYRLCERIWKNTQSPLEFDGNTSPANWASLSTGHNLRWEVVGLIIAEIGLAAGSLDPLDDVFREHNTTCEALSKRMFDAVEACLSFCRECETREDLFQWFLNEAVGLTGSLKGSGSYISYQRAGELINAHVAMGFQQEIRADSRTPFFLAEIRKRSRISCYGQEVAVASLLGRPCRLSYRYTSLELPLELSDAELFSDGEQLTKALANIDSEGWNKTQRWQRITYMRANMLHAPRREDVIDLSLGNYTQEEILELVSKIRKRYEVQWSTAPDFIREVRGTPSNKSNSIIHALYMNVVRHGYLANELFLQQVLIRKTGAPPDELIKSARMIFKDCMSLSARRGMLKDYRMDSIWILASQGLRSASILAVELYKQEQLPIYPTNPRLPRAETIRELSIFVERLSGMDLGDGWSSFCDRGTRIIGSILNKILAPPRAVATPQAPHTVTMPARQQQPMDTTMLEFPGMDFGGLDASLNMGNDADFMQWLDTMDWEKHGGVADGGWTGLLSLPS